MEKSLPFLLPYLLYALLRFFFFSILFLLLLFFYCLYSVIYIFVSPVDAGVKVKLYQNVYLCFPVFFMYIFFFFCVYVDIVFRPYLHSFFFFSPIPIY